MLLWLILWTNTHIHTDLHTHRAAVAYLSVWELFIAVFFRMHTLKYVMYGMNMGNETIKN